MNRRIVVTGAGGFVGRELLRQLSHQADTTLVAADAQLDGVAAHSGLEPLCGDLSDAGYRRALLGSGLDALVHLAAVPGGAAEADPVQSQRVNIEATLNLLRGAAGLATRLRVVFASTIAVYGDPLPEGGVDDSTQPAPRLIYGAHKAMIETMIAALSRREAIDGISLRLPGIVARPRGASGMKSAFMSNVFHASQAGEHFVSPVSPAATLWLMSVTACAQNLIHALDVDTARLPQARAFALPALRVSMGELVETIAHQTGAKPANFGYAPDVALERAFGKHPPLTTAVADAAGFQHDGTLEALVRRALTAIQSTEPAR